MTVVPMKRDEKRDSRRRHCWRVGHVTESVNGTRVECGKSYETHIPVPDGWCGGFVPLGDGVGTLCHLSPGHDGVHKAHEVAREVMQ